MPRSPGARHRRKPRGATPNLSMITRSLTQPVTHPLTQALSATITIRGPIMDRSMRTWGLMHLILMRLILMQVIEARMLWAMPT